MLDQADGRGATILRTLPEDRSAGPAREPATGPEVAAGSEAAPPWRELSHELRTPLHAILGNVELLLDGSAGPISAQARACLGDVQGAGRQLLRQVALVQLLVQAMATREPHTEGVLDVLAALRTAFAKRGMAGEIDISPDDAELIVRGDPAWLETMATALVEMLRLTVPGGSRISIAIDRAASDAAAGDVALRVAARGAEPVAASPVRATLVEAIVRLHGGRVAVTAGSELVLSWPAARVAEHCAGSREAGRSTPSPGGEGRR